MVWTLTTRWKLSESLPRAGVVSRFLGRHARSLSLYWLSYPDSYFTHVPSLSLGEYPITFGILQLIANLQPSEISINYWRLLSPRATPRPICRYFRKQTVNLIYRSAAIWLCCALLDAQYSSRSLVSMALTVLNTGDKTLYRVHYIRHTYLFTPWCRVLLEKPIGLQLVEKFPALVLYDM